MIPKMLALPVISKEILHSVRAETHSLLKCHPQLPTSPMLKPFINPTNVDFKTPMRDNKDWSLLIYLPSNQTFFVTNEGALCYNFNPKIKPCYTDRSRSSCKVWNGTVLGVERTEQDWYAVDAYVVCGKNIMHLPFAERRHELNILKQTCMPELSLVHSLQDVKSFRTWSNDPLI